MTHDGNKLALAWSRAATTALQWLEAGKDVLFLVEGDASTYATFSHLARTVHALNNTVSMEVIAGINSFTAACAHATLPLAEQDGTIAIIPASYGLAKIDRLLADFDTLVLMKVKPLLDEILDWLQQRDLLQDSCFAERIGTSDERLLMGTNMLQLRGEVVNYLSLLIVKNPHRLRENHIHFSPKKNNISATEKMSDA